MEITKEQYYSLKDKVNEEYCNGMQGDEFVDLIMKELKIVIK